MDMVFRGFMSSFFTGVTVVTSIGDDDRPHGLTCTSLTGVTLEPPTLLICLNLHSGTLAAVRSRGAFLVNLLHQGGREAAEVFASDEPDRFTRIRWQPSLHLGLPGLPDHADAVAECLVTGHLVVGDHAVVLGQVVAATSSAREPLLYGMRDYACKA